MLSKIAQSGRLLSKQNLVRNVRSASTLLEPTAYSPSTPEPPYHSLGKTTKLNLFSAINSALKTAMMTDASAILFGEDVSLISRLAAFECRARLICLLVHQHRADCLWGSVQMQSGVA